MLCVNQPLLFARESAPIMSP